MKLLIHDMSLFLNSLDICYIIHISKKSTYIKVLGVAKLKQIRFSDHEGRKTSKHSWQVRSDRETQRKFNIFNHKDIKLMKSLIICKTT